MTRRLLLQAACAFTATALCTLPALAQEPNWPTRPLRIIVPFGPGSGNDIVARLVGEHLTRALGQPVVVDNRAGAGGNLAATLVARATDGHTLGLMINGNLTTARLLQSATAYDPQTDLAPVALLGSAPLLLCTGADAPAGFSAWLARAREAGARWNFGSPGTGTLGHLGMELLQQRTGLAAVHVPYPGNPQVVAALLAGEVQMALLPPGLAGPLVRSGRLKAVLATVGGRSALAPEVRVNAVSPGAILWPEQGKDDFARVEPSSKKRKAVDAGIECIGCGVCYSSCEVVTWKPDYLGPAALSRAWTLVSIETFSVGVISS